MDAFAEEPTDVGPASTVAGMNEQELAVLRQVGDHWGTPPTKAADPGHSRNSGCADDLAQVFDALAGCQLDRPGPPGPLRTADSSLFPVVFPVVQPERALDVEILAKCRAFSDRGDRI